jgi:hypothetical protein
MFSFFGKDAKPQYKWTCSKHPDVFVNFYWQTRDVHICSECVFEKLIETGIQPMEKKEIKNG